MNRIEQIKQKAARLGFDLAGITDAKPIDREQVELFTDWLKQGYAGTMNYMHNNFEKRIDPSKHFKNAKSVICLGLNFSPPSQKQAANPTSSLGRVAAFAQYEDYHLFIKKQLRELTAFLNSLTANSVKSKICVDSAPIAERAFAARAGLGFIGKNHMLINPQLGSQILLAEIITDLKLPPDQPINNTCSNCDKCLKACPTAALLPDGQFNANNCISYLTIEYKGPIPPDLEEKIGDRLFGCDQCALACPYQKDAPACKNKQFRFYPRRAKLNLREILDLTENSFHERFADSPIERLGLERLKRNAKICQKNSHHPQ